MGPGLELAAGRNQTQSFVYIPDLQAAGKSCGLPLAGPREGEAERDHAHLGYRPWVLTRR